MYLVSIRLQNFRQHKDTYIQFGQGITGILGHNGSGKSTVLEAIAWAFYGNKSGVLRGSKDTLIWRNAPGRSTVEVDLEFRFAGHNYRLQRGQSGNKSFAQLTQNDQVIANSITSVDEKLHQLLRMDHREFFNSYFTGQKELQFLGSIDGATDREKFIAKMLGYEKIDEVIGDTKKVNTIRYDLKQTEKLKDQLEGYLQSFADLDDRITTQQQKIQSVKTKLQATEQEFIQISQQKDTIEPQWQQVNDRRQSFLQLQTKLQGLGSSKQKLDQEISSLKKKQEKLKEEMVIYQTLAAEVADYNKLQEEFKSLSKKYQSFLKLQNLQVQFNNVQQNMESLTAELSCFVDLEDQITALNQAMEDCQNQINDREEQIKSETLQWQHQKAECQARINAEKQAIAKLEKQLQIIIEAGEEGVCPTCERPLQEEYDNVVNNFIQQKAECEAHLADWQTQEKVLARKPASITELEESRSVLQKELRKQQKQREELLQQQTKKNTLEQQLVLKDRELLKIQAEMEQLDQDFDLAEYQSLELQLNQLTPKYESFLKLAQTPKNLQDSIEQLSQKEQEQKDIEQQITVVLQQIEDLAYNQADFDHLQNQLRSIIQQYQNTKDTYNLLKQQLNYEEQNLQQLDQQKQEYILKVNEKKEVNQQYSTLKELESAFIDLRQYLTEQIRPQLADSASYFLQQLTEGRYDGLRIDENYKVIVKEQEQDKPVISGGEEDIVNLSLRLAISQMITERTGQPFSLLILDEVFGSLDQGRRDNVLHLLHRLEEQFEQVLIITHVDDIKDSLSHAIRLAYDPVKQHTIMLDE